MASKITSLRRTNKEQGQSLVEIALFLPIFLIIIAGMVEISQLVVTQNIVTDAVRASTRFGASGGEDEGMVNIIMNAVPTPTINLAEDAWDIWSIRATIGVSGTAFVAWNFTHLYGISQTVDAQALDPLQIQQDILAELQIDHTGNTPNDIANNLQIIGTYAIYDTDSILGLDAVPQLSGLHSITELNVTRVNGLRIEQGNGCAAFPVAVSSGIGSSYVDTNGDTHDIPNSGDFDYPSSLLPNYFESFVNNPDTRVDLNTAREGTIFKVFLGRNHGNGDFGWLKWNTSIAGSEAGNLTNSLTWPGNSTDYSDYDGDPGTIIGSFSHVIRGYVKPGDLTDTSLHIGDWVYPSGAGLPEIETAVQEIIDTGRELRFIVWGATPLYEVSFTYPIEQFAIFRIYGYGNSDGAEWLLLEFVRKDSSCGQQ